MSTVIFEHRGKFYLVTEDRDEWHVSLSLRSGGWQITTWTRLRAEIDLQGKNVRSFRSRAAAEEALAPPDQDVYDMLHPVRADGGAVR